MAGGSGTASPLIVGVSGLRGIVGESLTPEVAYRFARAFAGWLVDRSGADAKDGAHAPRPKIVIGADGRAGYRDVLVPAIAGIESAGARAIPIGVAMTPSVAIACDAEDAAGIVITASHNPQEWNGLKCLLRTDAGAGAASAAAPPASLAAEIIARFERESAPSTVAVETERASHSVRSFAGAGGVPEHVARIERACVRFGLASAGLARGVRVVVDSLNASGRIGARALAEGMLHADLVHLGSDTNGVFPHPAEPTRENLSAPGGICDVVREQHAAVGFAQDPDADRLAIIDERGEYIGEEYTLALAAYALLLSHDARKGTSKEHDARTPVLVANLSTSRMIDDVAAKLGARVERTPVGEANVVERMKSLRDKGEFVLLGGEGNGGVIWPEATYVRDSLSGMALVLALMQRTGKRVSALVNEVNALAGGSGYAILKRKVDIPSKDAAKPAVDAVKRAYEKDTKARVDLQDGVRVDWPDRKAWLHVRASNTEPIMRLIAESTSSEDSEQILGDAADIIRKG
ncbi:MAG: hypothetical protein RBS39_10890 [Phycisphaerales bacterium]|jgi:phosphomannomutase|nr:hypothetical protein [Phycisphaerales bacterium]